MELKVKKRSGSLVKFDESRIRNAVERAMKSAGEYSEKNVEKVVKEVLRRIKEYVEDKGRSYISVEEIQDIIEITLMHFDFFKTAKAFILYREEKQRIREEKMKILKKNTLTDTEKRFSLNAIMLLARRYLARDPETGKFLEDVDGLFKRVAVNGAISEIIHDPKVFEKDGENWDVWEKAKEELKELREEWREDKEAFRNKYCIMRGFCLNEYHFERLLYAYEMEASEGRMKVTIKELLKMLEENPEQFENARKYVRIFFDLMTNQMVMPNTPALVNSGRPLGMLSACFTVEVGDDLAWIMDTAKEIALITKAGGGIGVNFSPLRPPHESVVLSTTNNPSSGAISWLKLYNEVLEQIKQGGCVSADSYVVSGEGLVRLSDFLTPETLKSDTPSPIAVVTESGKLIEPILARAGEQTVRVITTKHGYQLKVAGEDKVLVANENGFEWKPNNQIREGDILVLKGGWIRDDGEVKLKKVDVSEMHGNTNTDVRLPEVLDEKLAELVGIIIAKGVVDRKGNRIVISIGKDEEEFKEHIVRLIKDVFGYESSVVRDERKGTYNITIYSKVIVEFLVENGLACLQKSKEKFVPPAILKSNKKVVSAFLRGLFEGDGDIAKDGTIKLSTSSERLAREVQLLLLGLGIPSSLKKMEDIPDHLGDKMYYVTVVSRVGHERFAEMINFISKRKKSRVRGKTYARSGLTAIPFAKKRLEEYYSKNVEPLGHKNKERGEFYAKTRKYFRNGEENKTLHLATLLELIEEYPELHSVFEDTLDKFFDEVVGIDTEKTIVYHLEVPEEHNYIANGFIVHNIRRGAGMGILEYWHPQVFDFIHAKEKNRGDDVIANFNLSVGTDEKFWEAVYNDEEIELIAKKQIIEEDENGNRKIVGEKSVPVRKVRARDILDEVSRLAWAKGDPAFLFFHNGNRYNIRKHLFGEIRVTNPCVVGDTKILTENGKIEIAELFEIAKKTHEKLGTQVLSVEKDKLAPEGEDKAYLLPMRIYGMDGNLYEAYIWKMGRKKVFRVVTDKGRELVADAEHEVLVSNGEFKKVSELTAGDVVMVRTSNRGGLQRERVVKVEEAGEGVVYTLTVPVSHTYVANGFVSANCGEEYLYPYESCNLASINVEKFVKYDEEGKPYFDWDEYAQVIRYTARLLDNFLDVNKYPLEKIRKKTLAGRNIGVGLMGIANALFRLGIPYNSEEGFKFMSKVAEYLTYYAFYESTELARERGTFSYFDKTKYVEGELPVAGYYDRKSWTLDWDALVEKIKRDGLRNVDVTTSPPTGSVSMISDTSNGIEPLFSLAYKKVVSVGTFYYVNPIFEEELKKRGLYSDELLEKVINNYSSVQGIKEIPKDMQRVFVTAMDIHWLDHIIAQVEIQKWITNSISKTINLPNSASVDDVRSAFIIAERLGAKGTTIYRDGSLETQVYVAEGEKKYKEQGAPSKYAIKVVKRLIEKDPRLADLIGYLVGYNKEKKAERKEEKPVPSPTFSLSVGKKEEKKEIKKEAKKGIEHHNLAGKKVSELSEQELEEVKKLLGVKYCPVCFEERGELVELIHEAGCESCPVCGWSACTIS